MSEAHANNPFGCSTSGGRWNPNGSRMIYAGSAPSVALLEYLCIKGTAIAKNSWRIITFEITDDSLVGTLEVKSLPVDWNALPHGKATQDFGKVWLAEMEFPFLKVPSSRIDIGFYPLEHNLLINPDFPALGNVLKVVNTKSFNFLLNPT